MEIKFKSNSEELTREIAEKYAKSINAPCVISLVGDLGAGKTTFAKGFALGMGITDTITSPTFTIMNEYEGGRMPLYHFDMYRINTYDDLYSTGFFDYVDTGVLIIEWSENIENALPDEYIRIEISHGDSENERIINIEGIEI